MKELTSVREFANHLRHCLQEEHNIAISEKGFNDIIQTILGANRVATKGAIDNVSVLMTRYQEQVRAFEALATSYAKVKDLVR